jgi:hypothetical protein
MRVSLRAVSVSARVVAFTGALCLVQAAAASRSSATLAGAAPGAHTAQERTMEAVVRAWSARLDAGDNVGIARLFSLPATMIQAPLVYRLVSRHEVAEWHASLPCSGTIVSISYSGRVATAVFRLGQRRSAHRCSSPGALAAARFEIVDGKIVVWEQIAVPAPPAVAPAA